MSISMEEALGLEQPKKPLKKDAETDSEEEYSEADLKLITRRKIVFERRARGDTDEEILHFLAQKGYPISRRTLHYDLKSEEVTSFKDELMRLQLRDIALLRGLALKNEAAPDLKALSTALYERGQMIRNLMPKEGVRVELNVQNQTNIDISAQVNELIEISREDPCIASVNN